jgi:glycosyltransferase involved in cell wall biosynthesis
MPLVSICIPTYNHARFLTESLRAASAQTFGDLEIVVLDNDSQDGTQAVVEKAAASDPRIRYLKQPRNIGLVGNLNACLECAQGKYVKILCADDSLEPGCVSAMIRVFDEHPTVSLVGCARIVSDANLTPLRIARARTRFTVVSGTDMLSECFFFGNRIGEPTAVMFKRADSMRGFSQDYHLLVDLEMWFHLLSKGDFAVLPQALCRFRTHAGQATNAYEERGGTVDDRKLLFKDFAVRAGKTAGVLRKCLWDFRMAYIVARTGARGGQPVADAAPGTFFPRAFSIVTYPMVKVMTAFGLRRAWRTA